MTTEAQALADPTVTWDSGIREILDLKSRIQERVFSGIVQQRHIWYPCRALPWMTEIHVEEWIRGIQSRRRNHPPGSQ